MNTNWLKPNSLALILSAWVPLSAQPATTLDDKKGADARVIETTDGLAVRSGLRNIEYRGGNVLDLASKDVGANVYVYRTHSTNLFYRPNKESFAAYRISLLIDLSAEIPLEKLKVAKSQLLEKLQKTSLPVLTGFGGERVQSSSKEESKDGYAFRFFLKTDGEKVIEEPTLILPWGQLKLPLPRDSHEKPK